MEDFGADDFDELIEIDDPFAIFKDAEKPLSEGADDDAEDSDEAQSLVAVKGVQ